MTDGRRREFADFPELSSEAARRRVPDPQAASTFEASRLRWEERDRPPHQSALALYRALIALRLDHRELGASAETAGAAEAPDEETLVVRRADGKDVCWIVVRFRGAGSIDIAPLAEARSDGDGEWTALLTTEEPVFALNPRPPQIDRAPGGPSIRFERPGAVILKQR